MGETKRIFYYDVLRALAIIGILFCHVSAQFLVNNGAGMNHFRILAFFNCFRDFSVPIFIMLSGALLINKKDSVKSFFKKRFSRIFIPFIFWFIIYVIYSFVMMHKWDAIGIFFGTPKSLGVIFWFVWMIMTVYIEIFILNKIIQYGNSKHEGFDKKLITILAVLSVIYLALVQFKFIRISNLKLLTYASYMTYAIIGYYLANNDILENNIGINKLVTVAFILFAGSYCWYIFGYVVPTSIAHNNISYLKNIDLLIVFISVSLFLFFKFLSKTSILDKIENNITGSFIAVVSGFSYGIYLSHYLFLRAIKMEIMKYTDIINYHNLSWFFILLILTFLVDLAVLWAISKIPYLDKVSGKA